MSFVIENGELLKYEGNDSKVVIPNGVTSIGDNAFSDCSKLESIVIPDSVTSIGWSAFSHCEQLKTVNLPNSLTSIGQFAFYDCQMLESVTIPNGVTSIGQYAFENCKQLKTVNLPNSLTSIGPNAFSNCCLESVILPWSLKEMGNGAFEWCPIKELTIPDSLTSISDYAFQHCTYLTTVTIPQSVTTIGKEAFYECSRLKKANISLGVTSIGEKAFYRCYSLGSITIPNSVTKIGKEAFLGCTRLKTANIPTSVKNIGSKAFFECNHLTINCEIENQPKGWTKNWASKKCVVYWAGKKEEKTRKKIVATPTEIRQEGSFIIEDGKIKKYIDIEGVEQIATPEGVTEIMKNAFSDTKFLKCLIISEGVKLIANEGISSNSIERIELPSTLEKILMKTLEGCTALKELVFNGAPKFSNNFSTFYGWENLRAIYSPKIYYREFSSEYRYVVLTGFAELSMLGQWMGDSDITASYKYAMKRNIKGILDKQLEYETLIKYLLKEKIITQKDCDDAILAKEEYENRPLANPWDCIIFYDNYKEYIKTADWKPQDEKIVIKDGLINVMFKETANKGGCAELYLGEFKAVRNKGLISMPVRMWLVDGDIPTDENIGTRYSSMKYSFKDEWCEGGDYFCEFNFFVGAREYLFFVFFSYQTGAIRVKDYKIGQENGRYYIDAVFEMDISLSYCW